MCLFSIIIPIFNSEKYLKKCVSSIMNQDFEDFELILVDDGSSDSSVEIMKRFSDARIRCLFLKHGGVSAARNEGLKSAQGEYVWFVDSDDEIAKDAFSVLADEIKDNHPDLIRFSFMRIHEKREPLFVPYASGLYKNEGLKKMVHLCLPHSWDETLSVCFHVYKNELINDCFFLPHEEVFAEDILFNEMVYPRIRSLSVLSDMLYFYYVRENSESTKKLQISKGALNAYNFLKNYYQLNQCLEEYREDLLENYFWNVIVGSEKKGQGVLTLCYLLSKDPHKVVKEFISSRDFSKILMDAVQKKSPTVFEKEMLSALLKQDEEEVWKILSRVNG